MRAGVRDGLDARRSAGDCGVDVAAPSSDAVDGTWAGVDAMLGVDGMDVDGVRWAAAMAGADVRRVGVARGGVAMATDGLLSRADTALLLQHVHHEWTALCE